MKDILVNMSVLMNDFLEEDSSKQAKDFADAVLNMYDDMSEDGFVSYRDVCSVETGRKTIALPEYKAYTSYKEQQLINTLPVEERTRIIKLEDIRTIVLGMLANVELMYGVKPPKELIDELCLGMMPFIGEVHIHDLMTGAQELLQTNELFRVWVSDASIEQVLRTYGDNPAVVKHIM